MKLLFCAFSLAFICSHGLSPQRGCCAGDPALAQSGRRVKENKPPSPPVEEQVKETSQVVKQDEASQVTAEKNQDYRCTDDGTLARILENETEPEEIFSAKVVDTRPVITAKPKPSYTKDARRNGVQGNVILKVVLSANGKIGRVRVVRRLPTGLTESAIKTACKIEFKPAMKDGHPVAQWLTVEYAFRLADSSILGP
jgi:TonB family protein